MGEKEYIAYYKKVLNLEEKDFVSFEETIEKRLPYAFRITDTQFSDIIKQKLKKYKFLEKFEYFKDVYQFEHPETKDAEFKEFIAFLVNQTNIGAIQRQEIVSMIPVSLLDIKQNTKIIDMCAAPGSKTKQILEIVSDEGLVIANDQSYKRVNILSTETSKRPRSSIILTQQDACFFPKIYGDDPINFDRILCDVPCSSDGTVRKNPKLLKEWNYKNSVGLCSLQYRILKRACELVELDGLVSYSTCSLNPLENEAVVQKILESEEFELIDFRNNPKIAIYGQDNLSKEKLIIREGLKSWYAGDTTDSEKYMPSKDYGLEKCIRIYPQDQNTGGFFIAILKRIVAPKTKLSKPVPSVKNYFCNFLPSEFNNEILSSYSIDIKDVLISKSKEQKNISAISHLVSDIIKNTPKLKIIDAGYKILSKNNMKFAEYRFKNILHLGKKFGYKISISDEAFKNLLASDFVKNEILDFKFEGLTLVYVKLIDSVFCGYGSENSFGLFINSNTRKALRDLVIV